MSNREKVIEGFDICLENIESPDCPNDCPYLSDCSKYENGAIFQPLMRDAIALLKKQEWHMLTEDDEGIIHGLPGDDEQYLMTNGKDIWIDYYVDGVTDGIILDSGRDIREITAWMYMPELPKKEGR